MPAAASASTPASPYARALARLSRRDLLQLVPYLGAAILTAPRAAAATAVRQRFVADPFPLGVASGDPDPAGLVLWTRLAPDPLRGGGMPPADVEVRWELAADSAFRRVVGRGTAVAAAAFGHSVHVEVTGLEPAREYWYRFDSGGAVSPAGRARTAPAPGAPVDRLRFAVCGCSHFEEGYFTAFRRLAEEQFDFFVHTGDYIYESPTAGTRVRPHLGGEPLTLEDYRNRYAQYKSDPDLKAAHASAPAVMTWDDHEVVNNYAGDHDERGTPAALFRLRRAAAYQAYYEAMPLRPAARPSGAHLRLYRRLRFGRLVDLLLLDTRQWRSDQACGDGNRTGCAAAFDRDRTMLGGEQERWLSGALASARGRWTVIGQQVPTFVRDMGRANPAGRFSMDKWDGYAAARDCLYRRIRETRAPNPVVLSGDVHQHYAADLTLDVGRTAPETIGAELTNTSISSNGDGSDELPIWREIRSDNPHIKYHSARRGYVACTATPASVRAEFTILDRVSAPGAPARVGGTAVVEAGRPGVQV